MATSPEKVFTRSIIGSSIKKASSFGALPGKKLSPPPADKTDIEDSFGNMKGAVNRSKGDKSPELIELSERSDSISDFH